VVGFALVACFLATAAIWPDRPALARAVNGLATVAALSSWALWSVFAEMTAADRELLFPRRRPKVEPRTCPLTGDDRIARLERTLAALESGGVIEPGEAALDALVARAGEDEEGFEDGDTDIYALAHVLRGYFAAEKRTPRNVRFFDADAVIDRPYVRAMVQGFAKLAGRGSVSNIEATCAGAADPLDPPASPNAQVAFKLDGRACVARFISCGKGLPIGLGKELADIFLGREDPRRFVSEYFDSFLVVSLLTEDQRARLTAGLAGDAWRKRAGSAADDWTFFDAVRD
jgi:hypothetical protein